MKSKLKGIQERIHRTGTVVRISRWKGEEIFPSKENEEIGGQDGATGTGFALLPETTKKLGEINEIMVLKMLASG